MANRNASSAYKGHGSEGQHTGHHGQSNSSNSSNSHQKGKSFCRIVTRFAEKTSMQGVPYINSAKLWWAKLLWGILLICALAAASLHLWYLCQQYYDYPKLTKIELGFNNLEFPALTICNVNQVHKGRLKEELGAEELQRLATDLEPKSLLSSFENHNQPPSSPEDEPPAQSPDQPQGNGSGQPDDENGPRNRPTFGRRKRSDFVYDKFNPNKYGPMPPRAPEPSPRPDEYNGSKDSFSVIIDTFTRLYMNVDRAIRARLGHNITDMLQSCTFVDKECPSDLFKLHQTVEYGNCYTLSSPRFIARLSGPSQGLSLTIYLDTLNYLKGLTHGFGARLHIHQKDTHPDPSNEGLFLAAAMETSIGLRMTTISRLGTPFGKCEGGEEFGKTYNVTYTRQTCQKFCLMSNTIESCGCYSGTSEEMALFRNSSLSPCRTDEEIACQKEVRQQYAWKEFECVCDNPCTEIQWSKTISQRQWPTDEYAEVLMSEVCELNPQECNLNGDDKRLLNLNFLKLNVYYEELNYQNITETPEIETAQFISDVGGALGLWIGLSILSMCELAQLLAELCDYGLYKTLLSKRRHRRRRRNTPPSTHPSLFVTASGPYATPDQETSYRPYVVLRR